MIKKEYDTPLLAERATYQAFRQHPEMIMTPFDYTALIGLHCDGDPLVLVIDFSRAQADRLSCWASCLPLRANEGGSEDSSLTRGLKHCLETSLGPSQAGTVVPGIVPGLPS
ncbi:conserved hypothetical protein [Ricinus communis]|uniref:Uncharacterized protein n=1 Tax=Ricinus communis TaxID=3988 RepID=B9SNK9_RICCO|nr:conserved hypothetical protein [Ricinus communis]